MKAIIRSITWADPAEKQDATDNYKHLSKDRLLNQSTTEAHALDLCLDFYQRHGEAPQFKVLLDEYEGNNNPEGVVLCEEVNQESFYQGASFADLFEKEVESQAAQNLDQHLRLAKKIATQGAEIGKQKVKGTDEAIAYLFSEMRTVPRNDADAIPANMRQAAPRLIQLYEDRKANPHKSYGIMTGYGLVDSSTSGIKKKQLYLTVGFGGHLKSTWMLNKIVNAAVAGWNPMLCSSEMPADDLKLMLVAIHSADPKFSSVSPPLSSTRLILGALNPQEEAFFRDVQDDLINNSSHGQIRVFDSGDFTTFGSVMQLTTRQHAELEVDQLWVDYITRLPVDTKYLRMDITAARNETLADAKRFAMSFDKGKGLPVCSPFQMNREGYKKAKANEGRADKTALAQYNAAEKEADVIDYIWFDSDEAATSEPKIGMMKSRWGALNADPVNVFIEPDSRRIFDLTAGMNAGTGYAPTSGGGADEVDL